MIASLTANPPTISGSVSDRDASLRVNPWMATGVVSDFPALDVSTELLEAPSCFHLERQPRKTEQNQGEKQ